DHQGVWIHGAVGLGTTRLAIIDPTERARQPMVSADGRFAITFNGEIYNYLELREELEQKGYTFRTTSDTEVLLALYITNGRDCLSRLRGMFSFAVWDDMKKRLFLARDRVGEKPLVYYHQNSIFAFASEIRALTALDCIPREVDLDGLHHGLHYLVCPAPYTPFKHIKKLKPGHCITIDSNGISDKRYWQPQFSDARMITSCEEACYEINRCLDETVDLLCRSDVPIGAQLSGGLDSSAVVASMMRKKRKVKTFCVSYDRHAADDEFRAARMVAEQYGTEHHELIFGEEQLASVNDIVKSFAEPFFSFVPMHAFAISEMIGRHCKVALTGSGGDELFGGYGIHRQLLAFNEKWKKMRPFFRAGLHHLVKKSPFSGLKRSAEKYARAGNQVTADFRLGPIHSFWKNVYSDSFARGAGSACPAELLLQEYDSWGARDLNEGFLAQQLMVCSQHSIVDIPDIAGMAHSVEYRAPFLDVRMVELAMRIPASMKVNMSAGKAGGKWVVRQAMRDRLPAEIIDKHKSGFGSSIPYQQWFSTRWRSFVEERLSSEILADLGIFDRKKLNDHFNQACNNANGPHELLWGVASLSLWLEEFI
ncbi:MAG: asparagine synthase (glutamine-hydrolyzing), partial [Proteobacteria bacterium]|nr:asparagine synthase (glutamine-hydrolyzing) [Pseudomonadota bacterium]